MTRLLTTAGCVCYLLCAVAAADAFRSGNTATARAFVAGLNTPTRAVALRLMAPSIRFRLSHEPWVRYVGPARAAFVRNGFGTNCALRILRQTVSHRHVRADIEERQDGGHPCTGGHQGTRVVFEFGFNGKGQVVTLSLHDE